MELQLAPGIGVELSLDRLASAAKLSNGTTIDLINESGSDAYKALMLNFVAEANNVRDGLTTKKSWMPWLNELDQKISWRDDHRLLAYMSDHYPILNQYLGEPRTPILDADNRVYVLVQDLIHLKSLSEAKLGTVINETVISFTSITETLGQSFAGYIRQSFRSAGFLVPMNNDGMAVEHAALSTVDITGPTLGIEYSDAALSLTLQLPNTDQPEYPHLERVEAWADVGSRFETTTDHWLRLAVHLNAFLVDLDPGPVTQILLTGDASVSNPFLHQIIADLFPEIDNSSYLHESPDGYIFAAARGAASRARLDMLAGGDPCIPDPSCELADGHPWKERAEL